METADVSADLSRDELSRALALLAQWRHDPAAAASCPRCARVGLVIEDRSARPHAEWYALRCAACGLDATLHIPLAPPAT